MTAAASRKQCLETPSQNVLVYELKKKERFPNTSPQMKVEGM